MGKSGGFSREEPGRVRHHPRSLSPAKPEDAGGFDYGKSPELFLGRSGLGPLRLAWDTNMLIDWWDFGAVLMKDDELLPAGFEERYEEDLVALGALMNLPWMSRDIRVRIFPEHLSDFGRRRRADRVAVREHQLAELAAALDHIGMDEPDPEPDGARAWRADFIPGSLDRALVEAAIIAGCHVFLTRDDGMVARAGRLSALGIVPMSPTDLLDALAESGELGEAFSADGLVSDNHRWQHLWLATKALADS